jgi:hypothetical protein
VRWIKSTLAGLLVQSNLLSRINLMLPVQSSFQKDPASPPTQITPISFAVSSLNEGRIAIVTDVGMGCGGRGSVGRATSWQGRLAKGL